MLDTSEITEKARKKEREIAEAFMKEKGLNEEKLRRDVWYLECSRKTLGRERDYWPILIGAKKLVEAILQCGEWLEDWFIRSDDMGKTSYTARIYPPGTYKIEQVVYRGYWCGGNGVAYRPASDKQSHGPIASFFLVCGMVLCFRERRKEGYFLCYPENYLDEVKPLMKEWQNNQGLATGVTRGCQPDHHSDYVVNIQSIKALTYLGSDYPGFTWIIYCCEDCKPVFITPGPHVFEGLGAIQDLLKAN